MIPFSGFAGGRRSPPLGTGNSRMPTTGTIQPEFTLVKPPERHLPEDQRGSEGVVRIIGLDLGQRVDPAAMCMLRYRTYPETFTGPKWPYLDVPVLKIFDIGYAYDELVDEIVDYRADAIVFDVGGAGWPVRDYLLRGLERLGHQARLKPVNMVGSNSRVHIRNDRRGSWFTVAKPDVLSAFNILQQRRVIEGDCKACASHRTGFRLMGKVLKGPGRKCDNDGCEERFAIGSEVYERIEDGKKFCFSCAKVLGRTPSNVGCPECNYLKIYPSPVADRLLAEMRIFKMTKTESGRETFEHRDQFGHGDLVIATSLACWFHLQGTRKLAINS